jgi:hypothetical protein
MQKLISTLCVHSMATTSERCCECLHTGDHPLQQKRPANLVTQDQLYRLFVPRQVEAGSTCSGCWVYTTAGRHTKQDILSESSEVLARRTARKAFSDYQTIEALADRSAINHF